MSAEMTEEWRVVPSFPGILASSLGRVWRQPYTLVMPNGGVWHRTWEPTFGSIDSNGRHKLAIGKQNIRVAPLVCEAFHGPKPAPGLQCMHLDEDRTHNAPGNLAWGTRKENMNAPKLKVSMHSRVSHWRLSRAQFDAIRDAKGVSSSRDLAAQYGISRGYVYQIWSGQAVRVAPCPAR
jgi:hypothetical protein